MLTSHLISEHSLKARSPILPSIPQSILTELNPQAISIFTKNYPSTFELIETDSVNIGSPLLYGEIELESFLISLETCRVLAKIDFTNSRFFDVGSGLGKAVLIASMMYNWNQCLGMLFLFNA